MPPLRSTLRRPAPAAPKPAVIVAPVASPTFTYSPQTGRYRSDASGKFVPAADVRAATDAAFGASEARARALTEQLRAGTMDLSDWLQNMRREVKRTNLYGGAAASGGWAHLTASDLGRIGQRVRAEYAYLSRMAAGLADGSIPLDGHAVARAGQYGQAGRATYWAADVAAHAARGYTEQLNVLGNAEHCPDCVAETAKGWQPLGQGRAIGARRCRRRDRCSWRYRRADGTT